MFLSPVTRFGSPVYTCKTSLLVKASQLSVTLGPKLMFSSGQSYKICVGGTTHKYVFGNTDSQFLVSESMFLNTYLLCVPRTQIL